jgi:predicted Zn-dependent protease
MTGQRAQDDVERALQAARGGDCVVIAEETSSANLRWADNTLTTNGVQRSRSLTVIAIRSGGTGPAVGVVSRSGVRADLIPDLVAEAERTAADAPAAPDAQPLLRPGDGTAAGAAAAGRAGTIRPAAPGRRRSAGSPGCSATRSTLRDPASGGCTGSRSTR